MVVTDPEGKVIGLITEYDILKLLSLRKNVDAEKIKARDVANTDYFCVPSDETVQTAM